MKSSINKFDYPTATSHTYKNYREERPRGLDSEAQKLRYREFDKEQRERERMKVQQENEKRQELERKQNKKKIEEELERKKLELIELEKLRNMAIEADKKSHELAIIRQEEERVQKIENERKAKENQNNAQNRFLDALKRLEEEKDVNSKKEKDAQYRRKVIEESEKVEREKAIKYRKEVEERERAYELQEKTTFKDYKQPLGRVAYNKAVDYTKTFLHNPNIIMSAPHQEENALEKADKHNSREKEILEDRKNKDEENRRKSAERGRIAMEKLAMKKEYEEYLQEQEEKARNYNLERIEAGKKNQYVGMKPATLSQMEANKRIRGEEEFEKMFFGGQNPEWFDKPANRYNIVQNKLCENEIGSFEQPRPIPIRSLGSIGGVVSDSHYSFESEGINELTSVKKIEPEEVEKPEQKKRVIQLSKQLYEGESNHKEKEDLRYSDSENEEA